LYLKFLEPLLQLGHRVLLLLQTTADVGILRVFSAETAASMEVSKHTIQYNTQCSTIRFIGVWQSKAGLNIVQYRRNNNK